MEFDNIEDIELTGYTEDLVDQFISMNDIDVDKALIGMPETLRSMFAELTFIGSAYLNPKIIKRFEESMRPKWDFTTDANRFFYNNLVDMGRINNWKISEYTVNAYMADDADRMREYQKYGGYNWVKFVIKMAEENESVKNIDNFYNLVKNYSLLREYWRKGLKDITEQIVKWKSFKTFTPRNILMLITQSINKVYTTLANTEEMRDLTSACDDFVVEKLQFPEQGESFAFPLMTQVFQGIRKGQFMAWGMLSNAGKSRFLIRLISNLAFVQNKKVLIISNEMTEEEMRACLITTTINNPDIQKLHGIKISKNQVDIQNGVYQADAKFFMNEDVVDAVVVRHPNETIEQYKDYVINEDGLKYIIKDYPDIMTNERSKISFLIHYDIAKYVISRYINIDDTYITIYSYNDFLKSMMFSDIDKHDSISIFEYIFVERFGANNYESVVGAYRSI